jgi:protein SCO1/2
MTGTGAAVRCVRAAGSARALLLALALAAAPAAATTADPLRHGAQPPAGIGGPLDLVDHRGRPFSLDRVAGAPALVFFGFTRCATTCPVALATAQQVLAGFDASKAPAIVFVTLDPLSDGPDELRAQLGRVDERLIGLTGRPDRIEQAAERFGVGMRPRAGGVDHSSMWYLLDRAGRLQRVYAYTTPATHLVEDIRRLVAR